MSIPFELKFSLERIFPTRTIKDEKNVFHAKKGLGQQCEHSLPANSWVSHYIGHWYMLDIQYSSYNLETTFIPF